MRRSSWFLGLFLILAMTMPGLAATQLHWNSKEFMGIDEIEPGMKGYGKTVYQGTKVETFNVEVVGVLRKLDFGFDMILVKVTSGPVVERKLQTVSGMSGSPIYIDGRLIGAYAYGWDFQQEPIAGVTPIAAMLDCTQPGTAEPPLTGSLVPRNRVMTLGNHLISNVKVAATHDEAAQLQAKASPTTMVLSPVATPLFASGFTDAAIRPVQKVLDRYNVRVMTGPGQLDEPSPKLEPGSAVAVSLMEGDVNLSAVGTVTYVKGDTVLAFGHPFFGMGKVDLPMSAAYVHGILNSAASSFKLASPLKPVGTLVSDRQFAVAGIVGQKATTFPITLNLTEPDRGLRQAYHADVISNPNITPALLYSYVLMNGMSRLGDLSAGEGTFTTHIVLSTDKLGDIPLDEVYAPQAGAAMMFPMARLLYLSDVLMFNPYEPVGITGVRFDVNYAQERNIAVIEKMTADTPVARPGDTVTFSVKIRPFGKAPEVRKIAVKVPEHATEPAMLVGVIGGNNSMAYKQLVTPFPTPEEGVRGLVRWYADADPANSMAALRVLPTPSYDYHGRMLRDIPFPLTDLLYFGEVGGMAGNSGGGGDGQDASADQNSNLPPSPNLRPTVMLSLEQVPYVLLGIQVATIAIDTDERVQSWRGEFDFGLPVPLLSSSVTAGSQSAPAGRATVDYAAQEAAAYPWFTPQQRARHAMLAESLDFARSAPQPILQQPAARVTGFSVPRPLSLEMLAEGRAAGTVEVQATPPDATKAKPGAQDNQDDAAAADDADASDDEEADASDTPQPTTSGSQSLLTTKRYSWGLTERKDFLRGRHMGTSVTSTGALVLVPNVRTIYQTNEMQPWKMTATNNGIYLAGWDTADVLRIDASGKHEVVFPKQPLAEAESVTALAADSQGNLLIATWPDNHVRMVKPDGRVLKEWTLPGTITWDLAVTSDGRRFAAGDTDTVYRLQDDPKVPLQVACAVPDKQVFVLTAGETDDLYLATYPRGKVYRLRQDGQLESAYEASGAVSSLAVDKAGNIYVGNSPFCRVYRVSADGSRQQIMRGMGRGNRHVLAMKMVGDDLYVATGPAGGIYRISDPTGASPDVSVIYARQDLRNGTENDGATGPESVMVNALAVTPRGEVLAATSAPAQVLKLEPRDEGAFISSVLQTPSLAHWGQLDLFAKVAQGQAVAVESRSGQTALPDETWSQWAPIDTKTMELTSAPASFLQFRVRMTGVDNTSPSLEFVRLYFEPMNQAPVVQITQPTAGVYWSGKKTVSWNGRDPDADELVYTVFISKDDGTTWTQLSVGNKPPEQAKPDKKNGNGTDAGKNGGAGSGDRNSAAVDEMETRKTSLPWDTAGMDDGMYRLRIVASDKYAKPTDAKSAESISGRFIVDNAAPKIALGDKVASWDLVERFSVTDATSPIIGGKFRIDNGPWIALTPEDGVFNSKHEMAQLISPNGPVSLDTGEHKVTIQVKDAADNTAEKTVTVVILEAFHR